MPSPYFFDITQASGSELNPVISEIPEQLKNLQSIQIHHLDNDIANHYPEPHAVLVNHHSSIEVLFQLIQNYPGIKLFYTSIVSEERAHPIVTSNDPTCEPNITTKPDDSLQQNNTASLDIDKLLHKIFLLLAWSDNKENQQEADRLAHMIRSHCKQDPSIESKILSAINDGKSAYQLINVDLQAHIKQFGGSIEQLQQWLQQTLATIQDNPRITKHLKITLNKQMKKLNSHSTKKKFSKHTNIIPPKFRDGLHPNSLKALQPHHHWQIFIDESGTNFESPNKQNTKHHETGRLVGLVVPCRKTKLPDLKKNFHAADESDHYLDTALNNILQSEVAVTGISIKNNISPSSPTWLSMVQTLIKMILRSLPLQPLSQKVNRNFVEIFIEERSCFTPDADFTLIEKLLLSELESLNQTYYADKKLAIHIEILPKNKHPMLGYADLLAHTWGGSSAQVRLKASQLLQHCFLEAQADTVEHIYMALDGRKPLSSHEWYEIVCTDESEIGYGLIAHYLSELGDRCQKDPLLWSKYLDEVRLRLGNRHYQPHHIDRTLSWLDRYRPANAHINDRLNLQWKIAKLAGDNHQGRVNFGLTQDILALAAKLFDEAAPETTQAFLRLAVTATNNFEFEQCKLILSHIDHPMPIIGKLNYAKRKSSLGQYYAFNHQYNLADQYFDEAIQIFGELSDPSEATSNIRQTTVYRMINAMNGNLFDHEKLLDMLNRYFNRNIDKDLLHHVQTRERYSFDQYLLLRAMVHMPNTLKDSIRDYIDFQSQWSHGEGHPWSLINFWRGWVLYHHNQPQAAITYFAKAAMCDDESRLTLQFISLVFAKAALALGVDIQTLGLDSEQLSDTQAFLENQLPDAPYHALMQIHDNLSSDELLAAIERCLPFNFK